MESHATIFAAALSVLGVIHGAGVAQLDAQDLPKIIPASEFLTVTGDYVCDTGTLEVRIFSPRRHRGLCVQGHIEIIKGLLAVKLEDYTPSLGEQREVLFGARSINGRYDSHDLPPLPQGLGWKVIYDDVRNGADFDDDGRNDVFLLVIPKPMPDVVESRSTNESEASDENMEQSDSFRRKALTEKQMTRIKSLQSTFFEVKGQSVNQWVDHLTRDANPDREIAVWERMAKAYKGYCSRRNDLTLDAKRDVFNVVLLRSMTPQNEVLRTLELQAISRDDAIEIMSGFE